MALRSPRTDLHPPSISKVLTTAGAQLVLANALEPTADTALNGAPAGVNHLPSEIWVLNLAAGGSFIWLDAFGNSNTLVTPAVTAGNTPFWFKLPCTAKSIEAGSTSGYVVVVAWHPEA